MNYDCEGMKAWSPRQGSIDIVIDALGGMALAAAWFCVMDGVALISISGPPEGRRPEELEDKAVKNKFFILKQHVSSWRGYRDCWSRGSVRRWWIAFGISRTMERHLKGWMAALLRVRW